jgi:hypothetical protein
MLRAIQMQADQDWRQKPWRRMGLRALGRERPAP